MPSNTERSGGRRNKRRRQKKSSSPVVLILIIVLVVLIGGFAAVYFLAGDQLFGEKEYYDTAAVVGAYHENGYTDPISEGALYPLVNTEIKVENGVAAIGFENVAANPYELQLTLLLNGDAIYTSGVIRPGSYIETAPLETVPEAGSHTVTARFIAYDAETQKAVGKVDYPETVKVNVG